MDFKYLWHVYKNRTQVSVPKKLRVTKEYDLNYQITMNRLANDSYYSAEKLRQGIELYLKRDEAFTEKNKNKLKSELTPLVVYNLRPSFKAQTFRNYTLQIRNNGSASGAYLFKPEYYVDSVYVGMCAMAISGQSSLDLSNDKNKVLLSSCLQAEKMHEEGHIRDNELRIKYYNDIKEEYEKTNGYVSEAFVYSQMLRVISLEIRAWYYALSLCYGETTEVAIKLKHLGLASYIIHYTNCLEYTKKVKFYEFTFNIID